MRPSAVALAFPIAIQTVPLAAAANIQALTPRSQVSQQNSSLAKAFSKMRPWEARHLYKKMFGQGGYLSQSGSPIQHIIVISMENRSVDNLLAGLYAQEFGSTGKNWGQVYNIANPAGPPVLSPISLATFGSPNHEHGDFIVEDEGNWSSEKITYPKSKNGNPITVFSYVQTGDITPYQLMIQDFASADDVYQANEGPSFEAHQYFIAGQTGGIDNNPPNYPSPASSPLAFADNALGSQPGPPPQPVPVEPWGTEQGPFCGSGYTATADTVNMSEPYLSQGSYPGTPIQACQNYKTIFDLLQPNTLPPFVWEYHSHSALSYWNAPESVGRLANMPNDIIDPWASSFISNEVKNQELPAVTFLTPCPYDSDHPNSNSTTGPSWVAWLVNTIGNPSNSNLWKNTAIILTWDDWGAWYDHVPALHASPFNPYNVFPDPNEWGFRVPFVVISAYPAYQGYVSHVERSQSSILDFIEWNFGLNIGALGTDDLTSSIENGAVTDYLQDMFAPNLTLNPTPVQWPTIAAPPYAPYYKNGQPACPPEKYF